MLHLAACLFFFVWKVWKKPIIGLEINNRSYAIGFFAYCQEQTKGTFCRYIQWKKNLGSISFLKNKCYLVMQISCIWAEVLWDWLAETHTTRAWSIKKHLPSTEPLDSTCSSTHSELVYFCVCVCARLSNLYTEVISPVCLWLDWV